MSSKLHCTFIFDSLLAGLGRNQVYGASAQKARKSVITRQQVLRANCSNNMYTVSGSAIRDGKS